MPLKTTWIQRIDWYIENYVALLKNGTELLTTNKSVLWPCERPQQRSKEKHCETVLLWFIVWLRM